MKIVLRKKSVIGIWKRIRGDIWKGWRERGGREGEWVKKRYNFYRYILVK